MKYKVCITAAGIGSRVSSISKNNKALLPINNQSVISKIIGKFDKKIEIIIAVGYQKKKVVDFIKIAHKDRKIKFVKISNYNKPGSGPGLSLLKCKKYLNCPFIFIACDTLVEEKIPSPKNNWIGISKVEDPESYLIVEKNSKNDVTRFFDKRSKNFLYWNGYANHECLCFIGLAGVKDYKVFWNSLSKNKTLNNGELQVSNGLDGLKNYKIKCLKFKWFDTGNEYNYNRALEHFGGNKVLPKPDEYFYKEKDIVIKYFKSNEKAYKRKKRSIFFKNSIPSLINSGDNYLAYKYANGELLSDIKDKKVFIKFLKFMKKNFWNQKINNKKILNSIRASCYLFYKRKTFDRVEFFIKRSGIKDNKNIINSIAVPKIYNLLEQIDWKEFCNPRPVIFHGDLQPENIVVNKNKFTLLDWREDFGGLLKYGDIYYDFGKLHHALIINGKIIRAEKYNINVNKNTIKYNFTKRNHLIKYLKILESFSDEIGLNIKKLRIMSSLIYLNIAPLHHYPYSELLYYHGKLSLFNALNNEWKI